MKWFTSLTRLTLCTAVGCALWGCGPQGGTDVGNGITTISLELSAYENTAAPKSIGLGNGVTIDSLYIAIDKVRLVPGASCEEDNQEVDLEGPYIAELTGGGILGGAPSFDTTVTQFCKLRVGYHRLEPGTEPAGTPPELLDHSIFVKGSRSDGTPFTIASRRDDRFELESKDESGFALPQGPNALFLTYEISSWIDAVDLDTLSDTTIVIDDNTNNDRLQDFENAVETSARLFKDEDADGVLEPDEVQVPLVE